MLLLLGTVVLKQIYNYEVYSRQPKPRQTDSHWQLGGRRSAWASVPRMGCHFEAHPTEIHSLTCVDRLIDWRYDIGDTEFQCKPAIVVLTAQKLTYFVSLCADMACHIGSVHKLNLFQNTGGIHGVSNVSDTPWVSHYIACSEIEDISNGTWRFLKPFSQWQRSFDLKVVLLLAKRLLVAITRVLVI